MYLAKAANALRDAIKAEQASHGKFEVPEWDPVTQKTARETILMLASLGGMTTMFARQEDVDPISWLIGTAVGWGGNPPKDAIYLSGYPPQNDGNTACEVTI
jgi:hypothetical protein